MKTRTWLLIFGTLALVCAAALFLLRPAQAAQAQIRSDGKHIASVDLSKDAEYRIDYGDDWNVVAVRDGKIFVESSSCANQDCVRRGAANGGAPIVCLPNRLVIEFSAESDLDALLG